MNSPQGLFSSLRRLILAPTCALLAASFSWAQTAATTGPDQASQSKPATSAAGTTSEEVVNLSPFEVKAENSGYYSPNTISGTRINTPIKDLASSISVVSKQQMQDFAMLDINDIFLYAAGTVGTGTYTDFTVDRNGSVSDNVQLNPTQANRIRGIAAANVSLGNVETMGRVPIDPVGIDSVEVSRGPNANVFGLGNPSGTVNLVPSSANLTREFTQVTGRVDTFDGYRTSVDLNRILWANKLAFRFSGVGQHEGYVRKPSGTNTTRYNGMIKFQPFKSTTVSAAFSYYRVTGNRPNYTMPRDGVSYWIASGRPTWDPVAQQVHLNGATVGTFTSATGLPDYFANTFTGSTRSQLFIDQAGIGYWSVPNTTVSAPPLFTSALATNNSGTKRFMAPNSAPGASLGRITTQPLFTTTPSVSSKDIYDWSSINIASINRIMDRTLTSNFQIDQFFLNTPRQMLVGQVGFMREDAQRYARNLIGVANDNGQSGQLLVDVNENLLDGTPNPYFLRPYIGTDQPRTVWQPAKWDTYRAQLAYKLDLTQEKGWLKWLGLHELSAYDEYKYRINRQYSYRDVITDAHAWIPAGTPRGNQGAVTGGPTVAPLLTREYFRYYVGDNKGTNIDYAPSDFLYGAYPFVWGGQGGTFNRETAQLGQAAVTDSTGAGNNVKTILKTMGAVLQSHLLDDRIVGTLGRREDKQYVKTGSIPQLLNSDGISFNYDSINHWAAGDYRFNSGITTTAGVVVRPFQDLPFLKKMESSGGVAGYLADFLHAFSLTYDKSNSFTPLDPRSDLFLNPLPNSTGQGKDYGFRFEMFDGNLVVRVNHYQNKQLNARGGDASTISQRVLRTDVASTAVFLLATQATAWVTQDPAHAGWTPQQIQDEVARQIQIPTALQNSLVSAFNAGTIAATQDITAKGTEVEINYNPTKFWTVVTSFTDTQSINTNVSSAVSQWIAQRMQVWTTITDPRGADHVFGTADDRPVSWWTTNYGGSQTAAQNFLSFVQTPYSVIQQQDGKVNPQIRRYNVRLSTNFRLAGITDNHILKGFSVGGAVRWESRGAIGYYGLQSLPAQITDLDASRPIYDGEHYYVDLVLGYQTKLFGDKIPTAFQLNVRNISERGHLQPIGAYPDGTPNAYRIVDPRQFIFTVTFDL